MKKVLPIIVALILAAIASVGIVQWSKGLSSQGRLLEVVVASTQLRADQGLTQNDLQVASVRYPANTRTNPGFWEFIFKDYTAPENLQSLVGRRVNREIGPGMPILQSDLKPILREREVFDWKTGGPGQAGIEKGHRALSIPVQDESMVSGLVRVGDRVDIIVTLRVPEESEGPPQMIDMPIQMGNSTQRMQIPYDASASMDKPMTFYLMQDVEVLAVGATVAPPEVLDEYQDPFEALTERTDTGGTITVAVTPEQALTFAFAIGQGNAKFTLTLRRPGDSLIVDKEDLEPATFDSVLEEVGVK